MLVGEWLPSPCVLALALGGVAFHELSCCRQQVPEWCRQGMPTILERFPALLDVTACWCPNKSWINTRCGDKPFNSTHLKRAQREKTKRVFPSIHGPLPQGAGRGQSTTRQMTKRVYSRFKRSNVSLAAAAYQGVPPSVCLHRPHHPSQVPPAHHAHHSPLPAHGAATLEGPRQVEISLVYQWPCSVRMVLGFVVVVAAAAWHKIPCGNSSP